MAWKRTLRLPKNPPPSPESEEEPVEEDPPEEEEVEEVKELSEEQEDEEEDDSEEEDKIELGLKKFESGEEGEEWTESVNSQSPSVSGFEIRPIIPTKRPRSKDSEPAKKRPSKTKTKRGGGNGSRSRKKAKINKEEERKDKSSSGPSSLAVGKVWCEDDQIIVLQGLIDFKKEKGAIRPTDMAVFYESIKGKLLADISRLQLYDKVRRLKKKFLDNKEKIEDGEKLVWSKPHDEKTFNLSTMIWGTAEDTEKENLAGDDLDADTNLAGDDLDADTNLAGDDLDADTNLASDDLDADTEDFLSRYPNLSESFNQEISSFLLPDGVKSWLKDQLSVIGSAKAEEFEKKWQEIREQEAKIFLKKMTLLSKQDKLFLDSSKNM